MSLSFEEMINILPKEWVEKLKKSPQNPVFHSEGSVYNHIELVYNYLLEKEANIDLLLCAIFHDLGKMNTVKVYEKEKGICIQNIGHENFCELYIDYAKHLFEEQLSEKINWDKIRFVCKEHMRIKHYEDRLNE